MNYKWRSAQLMGALIVGSLSLSASAAATAIQEHGSASSSQRQIASVGESNIVIQDDSQTLLEAVSSNSYRLETAQLNETTMQVTEPEIAPPETEVVEVPETEVVEVTEELPEFETSADLLTPAESSIAQNIPPAEDVFPTPEEAVPDEGEIQPGRRTRSGSSYVGIGGNFGTIGDTSVGDSGLIIYSKIGLTRFFSVRPAVTTSFDEDATFLFPATLDIAPIRINNDIRLAPYVGGGAAVTTDGDFGPLVVGGVDLPLTSKLTATAGVNVGILDPVDLGVFVGIGYNFSGF